uniref:phospholipase A2 n=1 Tax=Myripristis murdjan TaxID=586833 RepID=A0A668AXU9_9TELE
MQSRYLLSVVLVLSSLIMPTTQDATVSGHLLCHRSAPAGEGQTLLVFVREETDGARSLYLSLWSEDTRLLRCEVSADPLVTEGYLSLCGRTGTQGQETTQRFNISTLLAPDGPCGPDNAGAPRITKRAKTFGSEGKTRRKRSWLFPGTLWCGTGSKAMGYEELGMFESADRCCREHDQCMHVIPAFTVNYGVFNSNFFTVSHCDCDRRFRECLFGVNDTISSMVGYSFFNILRIPCFELIRQRRCVKMYWWGIRQLSSQLTTKPYQKTTSMTSWTPQTASLHVPTAVTTVSTITTKMHKKNRKKSGRCGARIPVRGDTFQSRRKICLDRKTSHTTAIAPSTSTSVSPNQVTMAQRPSKTSLKSETTAKLWNNRLVCGILKHLDRCQHKILPLEKKYGLQNMESKTVYHCDCTSRLAGQIEHFKAPSILPSLLMDFVSRYCFKLPTETKCHNRKRF